MAGRVAEESVFRVRLNELFASSGRRLTNRAVVNGMADDGCRISTPYMSQLRTGLRHSQSDDAIVALAKYFGVSPADFYTIAWDGDRQAAYQQINRASPNELTTFGISADVTEKPRSARSRTCGCAGCRSGKGEACNYVHV